MKETEIVPFTKGGQKETKTSFFARMREIARVVRSDGSSLGTDIASDGPKPTPKAEDERS